MTFLVRSILSSLFFSLPMSLRCLFASSCLLPFVYPLVH